MHYRVIDEQTRVSGKSEIDYLHVVRVVDQPDGLSAAAHIEIDFDPSYQKLTLHHLDLVRDGKHLTRLGKRYPLLRRETQLERQMYDGRQTLSIVIDDVRVGDEIDYAFSLAGSNPVFDGKFVRTIWLRNTRGPEALHQVRLLAPATREIRYRVPAKDVEVSTHLLGDLRETVFRRQNVPRFVFEPLAPYSAFLGEQLQFSEFADWAEVARWGAELFAPQPGGRLLDQEAQEISVVNPAPAGRLLAALDFVQKEVRYFGTEIGVSTQRPAAPETVMKQRFGDCKDKVALLRALLARLNIPSTPVLVSLAMRDDLTQLLPSPQAFDHVIARVELDGTTYWLDATRAHQSGQLAKRQVVGLGQGLPLIADTTAPVPLRNSYDSERAAVLDRIHFQTFTDDPTLESRITLRGDLAEQMREALATKSLTEVAAQESTAYLKIYPKARATSAMQVESSIEDDALTIVQNFVVPDFWRLPEPYGALVSQAVPYIVVEALNFPPMEVRQQPLLLPLPGVIRHTIVIEYPEDVYREIPAARFDGGNAYLTLKERVQGTMRRVEYLSELRVNSDQVPAQDWPAFAAKVQELHGKLGFAVNIPVVPLDQLDALTRQLKTAAASASVGAAGAESLGPLKRILLSAAIDGHRLRPELEAHARAERAALFEKNVQAGAPGK